MPISVQPLVINYSFQANRAQATDKVDLARLDAAFAAITAKLNEVIVALDQTLRDDDTLDDGVLQSRHLSDEVLEELTVIANRAADA
jgi:hypothetical protein